MVGQGSRVLIISIGVSVNLSGYKTYLIGIAMIAFAGLGLFLGQVDTAKAGEMVLQALAIIFLRQGIAKVSQ